MPRFLKSAKASRKEHASFATVCVIFRIKVEHDFLAAKVCQFPVFPLASVVLNAGAALPSLSMIISVRRFFGTKFRYCRQSVQT